MDFPYLNRQIFLLCLVLFSCSEKDGNHRKEADSASCLKFYKVSYGIGNWKDSLVGPAILNNLSGKKQGLQKQINPDQGKSHIHWLFVKKVNIKKVQFQAGPGKPLNFQIRKFGLGKGLKVPQLSLNRSSLPGLLHLKNKEGVPGTSVQAICEDQSGRLWLGTDNGLAMYDGNLLHSFSMEDGLPNQYITSIVLFEKGGLAIGTKSGLLLTDGLYYRHISQKDGLLTNWITRLHSSEGRLFIGTESGLQILENGRLFTPDLPRNNVNSISGLPGQRMCISYSSGEVLKWDLSSRQLESIKPFPEIMVSGASFYREVEVLMSIADKGLFRWKQDSLFVGRSPDADFSAMEINSFFQESGKVWFCGFDSGLYGLDQSGNLKIIESQDGLISKQLSSLIKLGDGSFLLGSWGGVNILKDVESRQFFLHKNLNGTIPFGLSFGPDSALWISTMDGGINCWKNDSSYSFAKQSGLNTGTVFNFAFDKNGRTYMASSGNGLIAIAGKFAYTLGKLEGLASLNVNAVLVASDSSVYIGTNEAGLYKWRNDCLFHIQTQHEIPGQSVYSLYETPAGEIIIGTNGDGIFSLNKGQFKKLIHPKGQAIPAVYPIRWWNKQLCFGTLGGGLYFWKGDSLAGFGEKEGLANQSVASMQVFDDEVLVCGTGKGISIIRFQKNSLLIRNLNSADAFQYEDCNPYSSAFDGSNLWMGAGDSFLKLSAEAIRKIPKPLPMITGLEFGDREFLRLSTGGKLSSIDNTSEKNLEIPFELNTVKIKTGHSEMPFPQDKIEYAWQLFPIENSWKKSAPPDKLEYSRLDAGDYAFRFRVREAGMNWSPVQELKFSILPPWWQTWWFRMVEGLAGILFVYGVVQARTRNLRRDKEKLEGIVQERTAEVLEQKDIIELEKKKSDELLLNILPENVADELRNTGKYEARNFEEVSILFTDFKDFTKISEQMSPASLVKEIDLYFRLFDGIVQKHKVEKIKTIGDAYMAAGGIPVPDSNHAENVVSAALEMQEAVENLWKERQESGLPAFRVRIGIHSGPVVAGIVGSKKFAYDIWGDSVNLASRLESSGEAGKINISGNTYERVKHLFECEARGKVQAKNKGEVEMYFVVRRKNNDEYSAQNHTL